MSATRTKAGQRTRKLAAVICLLALMTMGLAACRGFFGQAPIALIDATGAAGDQEVPITFTFDISGSNDPDGTIAAYDLDYGDGSTHATGTDVTDALSHEYEEAGTYTVLLTITDNDGRTDMISTVVTIGPAMITFAASRVTQYDIFRMQADGTNQGAVLNTTDDELFPDLLRGTRDKIAYAAENGTSWNIWTMTVAGGSLNQLTTQTPSNQIQPSWSYDGSKIAYASNAAQTPSTTTWEIYTMTALGGTQTQLTTQTPSWAIAPAYSPLTNDHVLFVSNKDAAVGSSIWIWKAGVGASELYDSTVGRSGDASPALVVGSTDLKLPAGAGISKPAWSPDGTEIAFSQERSGGEIDIYVMDTDGDDPRDGDGDPISLEAYVTAHASYTGSITAGTITSDEDEFCPYWLEDGSGMVFVKEIASAYHVYKVSFTTGLVTKLTATGTNISPASDR